MLKVIKFVSNRNVRIIRPAQDIPASSVQSFSASLLNNGSLQIVISYHDRPRSEVVATSPYPGSIFSDLGAPQSARFAFSSPFPQSDLDGDIVFDDLYSVTGNAYTFKDNRRVLNVSLTGQPGWNELGPHSIKILTEPRLVPNDDPPSQLSTSWTVSRLSSADPGYKVQQHRSHRPIQFFRQNIRPSANYSNLIHSIKRALGISSSEIIGIHVIEDEILVAFVQRDLNLVYSYPSPGSCIPIEEPPVTARFTFSDRLDNNVNPSGNQIQLITPSNQVYDLTGTISAGSYVLEADISGRFSESGMYEIYMPMATGIRSMDGDYITHPYIIPFAVEGTPRVHTVNSMEGNVDVTGAGGGSLTGASEEYVANVSGELVSQIESVSGYAKSDNYAATVYLSNPSFNGQLQQAHDALPADGGSIIIPTGNWVQDDIFRLTKSDIQIRGHSSTASRLSFGGRGTGIWMSSINATGEIRRVAISDIQIVGSQSDLVGIAIHGNGPSGITDLSFERMRVVNWTHAVTGRFTWVDSFEGFTSADIRDDVCIFQNTNNVTFGPRCRLGDCSGFGVHFLGANNAINIKDSDIEGCKSGAIYIEAGDTFNILNNYFENNGDGHPDAINVRLGNSASGVNSSLVIGNYFNGYDSDGNIGFNLKIEGGDGFVIQANTFRNCGTGVWLTSDVNQYMLGVNRYEATVRDQYVQSYYGFNMFPNNTINAATLIPAGGAGTSQIGNESNPWKAVWGRTIRPSVSASNGGFFEIRATSGTPNFSSVRNSLDIDISSLDLDQTLYINRPVAASGNSWEAVPLTSYSGYFDSELSDHYDRDDHGQYIRGDGVARLGEHIRVRVTGGYRFKIHPEGSNIGARNSNNGPFEIRLDDSTLGNNIFFFQGLSTDVGQLPRFRWGDDEAVIGEVVANAGSHGSKYDFGLYPSGDSNFGMYWDNSASQWVVRHATLAFAQRIATDNQINTLSGYTIDHDNLTNNSNDNHTLYVRGDGTARSSQHVRARIDGGYRFKIHPDGVGVGSRNANNGPFEFLMNDSNAKDNQLLIQSTTGDTSDGPCITFGDATEIYGKIVHRAGGVTNGTAGDWEFRARNSSNRVLYYDYSAGDWKVRHNGETADTIAKVSDVEGLSGYIIDTEADLLTQYITDDPDSQERNTIEPSTDLCAFTIKRFYDGEFVQTDHLQEWVNESDVPIAAVGADGKGYFIGLNTSGERIQEVGHPTASGDAATKGYVDAVGVSGLYDTPISYAGHSGKYIQITPGETGVRYFQPVQWQMDFFANVTNETAAFFMVHGNMPTDWGHIPIPYDIHLRKVSMHAHDTITNTDLDIYDDASVIYTLNLSGDQYQDYKTNFVIPSGTLLRVYMDPTPGGDQIDIPRVELWGERV